MNCGLFKIPTWLKIILSSIFIIPMYFWVLFPARPKGKKKGGVLMNSGDGKKLLIFK